ncbi:MAG: hypothetical protein Q9167_005300 [Letrouitia subvulpina]
MTSDPVATQRLSRPPAAAVSHGISQTLRPGKAQEASLAPKEPLFNPSFETAQKWQRLDPKVANSTSAFDSEHTRQWARNATIEQQWRQLCGWTRMTPTTSKKDLARQRWNYSSNSPSHSTLPFPTTPENSSHKKMGNGRWSGPRPRAITTGEVQVKPFVPEPPVSVPRYHQLGQADFSPWTGSHSEDVLSELMIKQGFYDKNQFSHEVNATWPSLWSSLKHKSGLQILSSLLVTVLDRKQTQGMVGITSTFKPPPRVTLTDTKREAWLRDLANPTIPLRRLSRTIPHGIRNKVLLDQCLAKSVPIARAIWLAKCVGANEIRAFKRKGASGVFAVGGEMKWIREWTINVEQFLAMIIEDSKTVEWNAKLDYGLRLSVSLFLEHLLDQDHYCEWLATSLCQSDLANLPIWVFLCRIHLRDIVRLRHPGGRLTEAFLEQRPRISSRDLHHPFWPSDLDSEKHQYARLDLQAFIVREMQELLKQLTTSGPASFLLTGWWHKHKCLGQSSLDGKHISGRAVPGSPLERNTFINSIPQLHRSPLRTSCRKKVALLLESLVDKADYDEVAQQSVKRQTVDREQPFCVKFLLDIPSLGLPSHVINLRRILLKNSDELASDQRVAINSAKANVSQRLPGIIPEHHTSPSKGLEDISLIGCSQIVKSEVAHWLHQHLLMYIEPSRLPSLKYCGKPYEITSNSLSKLNMLQFQKLCEIFEELEEFSILADLLIILSGSEDFDIQNTAVITVTHYFDIFHAIGAASDLYKRLLEHYAASRGQKLAQKCHIESLIDLGERFPDQIKQVQELRKDLRRYERSSVTVYSPLSDSVVEALQPTENNFSAFDELEQALNSDSIMDERVFSRFFDALSKRFESSWTESVHTGYACGLLLSRLRSFGPDNFDHKIKGWLGDLICSARQPNLKSVLIPLVCASSISLKSALNWLTPLIRMSESHTFVRKYVMEFIDMLTEQRQSVHNSFTYRYYRFHYQRQQIIRSPGRFIGQALHIICIAPSSDIGGELSEAQNLVDNSHFWSLLRVLLLSTHQGSDDLLQWIQELPVPRGERVIQNLIHPSDTTYCGPKTISNDMAMILNNVGYFNGLLCRAAFQALLQKFPADLRDTLNNLISEETAGMNRNIEERIEVWSGLVLGLPHEQSHMIYKEAETHLYSLIASVPDSKQDCLIRLFDAFVSVLSAEGSTLPNSTLALRVSQIADKVNEVEALTHLLTVHLPAVNTSSVAKLSHLLAMMHFLLVNPILHSRPTLQMHVFNALALIIDSLPPELVQNLWPPRDVQDTRIEYLTGSSHRKQYGWLQQVSNFAPTPRPFQVRSWELMPDATPLMSENDTGLSLALFGARKATL